MNFLILAILLLPTVHAVETCDDPQEIPKINDLLKVKTEVRVEGIAKNLYEANVVCPEKIWPGYSWKGKKVIFHSSESNKAWEWVGDEMKPGLKEIEISKLPPNVLHSSYGVDTDPKTFDMTLFINLDNKKNKQTNVKTGDRACNLAGHEGFHFFEQFKFSQPWRTSTKERTAVHPISAEARYLRSELGKLLREAYLAKDSELRSKKLQEAKAVWQKWSKEFPDEKAETEAMEIVEGSAMFAEVMSSQLGILGCSSSREKLTEGMQNYAADHIVIDPQNYSIEVESYNLGGFSHLLLGLSENQDWKNKIENGVPPLTLLFESVPDTKFVRDESSFKEKKQIVDEVNKKIDEIIAPSLDALDSPDFVRVAISEEAFQAASIPNEGSYKLTQKNNLLITLKNSFERDLENGRIKMEEINTFHQTKACPTQESSRIVMVSKKEFEKTFKGDEVNIKTSNLEINGKGELRDGIFCLKSN